MKKIIPLAVAGALGLTALTGCGPHQSDVVSHNLSNAADNYQVPRKITFYNGITGKDILVVTGYCSLGNNDAPKELSFTCKTGPHSYIKDFLGLSDNVTYLAEQLDGQDVSSTRYTVTWIPQAVLPNVQVK